MLSNLLPELMEHVFHYCSMSTLKELACTCSYLNTVSKPHLFHTIKVPSLSFPDEFSLQQQQQATRYTVVFNIFYGDRLFRDKEATEETLRSCLVIAKLFNIRTLVLSQGLLHDEGLDIICSAMASLQVLDIGNTLVTDAGMAYLQRLTSLDELCLLSCNITGAGVGQVASIITLKKLDLAYCYKIKNHTYLSELQMLESMILKNHNAMTREGFNAIVSIVTLKILDLSTCNTLFYEGLKGIEGLVNMEELILQDYKFRLRDENIIYISSLKNLRKLDLTGWRIHDEVFSTYIILLSQLEELILKGCDNLTDKGLAIVAELENLKKLDLSCTLINEDCLMDICNSLPSLTELKIALCNNLSDNLLFSLLENRCFHTVF